MIRIDFEDGYTIRTLDALNIVLEKTYIASDPKKKNYGKEVTTRLGYYGNLRQALNSYVEYRLNDDRVEYTGAEKVIEAIKDLEEAIKKVTEE